MRIPTNAMLGMSRKLRVASQRETTKSLHKIINNSKAKVESLGKANFAPHQTSSWSAKKKGN